ncbi:MAG: MFS transporter [Proteobacteria bacterium]|nr:MFS transporter [Pseudomonadota bacterium]
MIAAIERFTGLQWTGQGPAFLIGLGHAGTHWIAATFYLLLPFITADLGLSYAEAGALVAVFHVSAVAANFASGLIVDVTGRRVVFQVAALVVGGGALLAFGLGGRMVMLSVLVALIGAANNLWHPAAIAFLSQHYPDNRGYALSIHALGANIGDAVAPLAAGALLVWFTWQGAASLAALPVLAAAALIALMLLPRDTDGAAEAGRGMGLGEYFSGLAELLRDKAVLGLCLMAGFRTMTQNGLLVFLPLYLADVLGVGPFLMGVALMAMQVAGMIAGPIAGVWSDRVGRRPVVLAGLTVATAVIAALTLAGSGPLFIAGISVLGFALFAARPVIHSWLMDLTPPRLGGSATSVMFGTQSGLSVLVAPVGGLIADTWGLAAVFYGLAGTMLVANVLVFLLPHHDPRATAG